MVLCRCDSTTGLMQMFNNNSEVTHRDAEVTFLGSLLQQVALIFLTLCFTSDKIVWPSDTYLPVASSLGLLSSL